MKVYKHEINADIPIFHLTGNPCISVWTVSNTEENGPVPFPEFIITIVR